MTLRTRTENSWEAGRKTEMLAKKARRKYTILILRSSKRTYSLRSFRMGEPAYLRHNIPDGTSVSFSHKKMGTDKWALF